MQLPQPAGPADRVHPADRVNPADRATGAALGAFIGDALAMPVHWYYDRDALRSEYGVVDRYLAPRPDHPGSILWRSSYDPVEPEFDILGAERAWWGRRGVHYHRNLKAGENTLNLKLLRLALELARSPDGYSRDAYTRAYIDFMLSPAEHRDTYVEECHRGFFLNLRSGVRPGKCAVTEKHIGGMVSVVPLYAALRELGAEHGPAADALHAHISVTHAGEAVRAAVGDLLVVAAEIWSGASLREALGEHARAQDLCFFTGPIARLESRADDDVVGRVWSTACYLEDSLPASFYLAWKHAESARDALVSNTMVGGDNCHRGAVIGALLGLAGGPTVFPAEWRAGLATTR